MKNYNNRKYLIAAFSALLLLTLFSCDSANPIYGKWADNYGNTIILNDSFKFKMTIIEYEDFNKIVTTTKGSYIVDYNTIILNDETNEDADPMLCEWDVRGTILYLSYKTKNEDSVEIHTMTLYKIGEQTEI